MNTKIAGLIIGLFCSENCMAVDEFNGVGENEVIASPDKRFNASLGPDWKDGASMPPKLEIADTKVPKAVQELDFLPPILGVFWLKNSKAFCTVNHLAGGSELYLYYYDGVVWSTFSVDPSDTNNKLLLGCDAYQVVNLQPQFDDVVVTYQTYRKSPPSCYLVKMLVHPIGEKIKTISVKRVGNDSYGNL